MALLVPAIAGACRRTTACVNNLHEIGVSTQLYVNAHDTYPAAWISGTVRWMDQLKPYVDKSSNVYRCPSDPNPIPCTWDPTITLDYGINCFCFAGQGQCFWYTVKSYAVRHPSNVILYADCTPGLYYCGGGGVFANPVYYVDYRHMGGTFNVAYCDGHVENRSDTAQSDWDASQ